MTTQPALSIGGVVGFSLGTASTALITVNATMKKITFHNPGSVVIYVCPALDVNGGALTAGAGLPGNFAVFPGGDRTITGDGTAGSWLGAAASGAGNPFTAFLSESLSP